MFFNTMMLAAVAAEEATSYTFREETGFDHSTNLALTLIARQLAISGDGGTALVSDQFADSRGDNQQTGSVAFFTKSGTSWNYAAQRSPSISGIRFGSEIALSEDGSTALIGAERENNNRGAVYVYANTGSSWQQQAKLNPAGNNGQYVGQSSQLTISADGNTAVISSAQNPNTGMTWVYTRSGTTWTLRQIIYGAGTGTELAGGTTLYESGAIVELSADGNTLAMRMDRDNSSGNGEPGVRVYTRSGNTFSFAQDLDVNIGGNKIATDISVSSDGSYIVVGVDNGMNASNTETGGVEVYKKSGSTWSLSTTLFPSDGASLDDFGRRVQVSGDGKTVAVGAPRHSSLRGAIYVYRRDGLTWTQDQKLQHANIASNDDLTENGLAMADNGHTILANMNSGSATYTKEFEAAYPSIATGSYAISFAENSTATVETYTATGVEPITWSISGTDAAQFTINSSTGALAFASAPDYEAPADSGGNNVYDLTVTATNAYGSASQAVAVTVTNDTSDNYELTLSGPGGAGGTFSFATVGAQTAINGYRGARDSGSSTPMRYSLTVSATMNVLFRMWGGGGGGGKLSAGGAGGRAYGTVTLNPGTTYYLVVAGGGQDGKSGASPYGGYGGGASGGGDSDGVNGTAYGLGGNVNSASSNNQGGGGGGGLSGLFSGTPSSSTAILIAGGGGGGGRGASGGSGGATGSNGAQESTAGAGGGGTNSAGGFGPGAAGNGGLGYGGDGDGDSGFGGGGGGGGHYGGGGGDADDNALAGSGGGGGASYASGAVSSPTLSANNGVSTAPPTGTGHTGSYGYGSSGDGYGGRIVLIRQT